MAQHSKPVKNPLQKDFILGTHSAKSKSIALMCSFDMTLYKKAEQVAKRRGLKVQDILRNLLSESVSNEILK